MERYLATLDHEQLLVRRGTRSGVFCVVAVHSTARGPALGGCRMWTYEDSRAAVRDALRLSRAMTFKSAVAGLPLGGGKGVIMLRGELSARARKDALRDFGDTVDALDGAYVTAEDVGTSARDMETIADQTKRVSGLSRKRGGSGDPSPYTALGVVTAIEVSCERVFGTPSLKGRSIAVVGLGHVGARIAKSLAKAGATLLVSDIDPGKKALADDLGAKWVTPEKALTAPVDVYAPCALGGILDHDSVPRLQCGVVAGAANNQLADDGIADLLNARSILWSPDFVANAGGIINIAVELDKGGYDPARAKRRVRGIGDTLKGIYDDAEGMGATPLTAAMERARRNLEQAGATMGRADAPEPVPVERY
ncbi:MAG: Branched-chain amino acid dehydrogenase [deaminating](EC [uncultured Solirubrobacteraceae bacterium]|uniref:Branched-chain amino acid dehydrogenase [deaminating](EC) n=1 Tax=uncultured Solirubrobacteraceae bacterium TaxID=1162706 RepID=A0A6J4TQS0_9ACTN|nr:MAG: Branched-chain amino acid dehydrogenase [deaminating](EC [uncultured Solirubrobacteraceae bacterium]